MKQKSEVVVDGCEVVVDGCEAVVDWVWWWAKGGFVVGVGRGVGLLIVDC